ncbi:MAG TPA: SDR family oxidoreductase [Patescibacteria group bacterium]|nr:SDR family oxidoreductase [Gammaproteobacteria bacterium]HWA51511.1 SDR family oxidoreductase [Patescibacteria group bacterium]
MKTILITGANRGLGLEMVRQYLETGWRVFACCRSPGDARELKSLSVPQLQIFKLDVSLDQDIFNLSSQLHNQPIDILVNNAGILKTYHPNSQKLNRASWLESFQINTISPVVMAKAFAPLIALSQHKLIVNISSNLGSISSVSDPKYLFYGSSKAALNYVTKSLTVSLMPQGISVISIHPGWVKTDMGGEEATLFPEESITSIRKLLEKMSINNSGSFYSYTGEIIDY